MYISWTTNDCVRACVVVLYFFFFFVCVRCFKIDILISLVFPRAVGWFVLVFLSPVLLDSDERCNSLWGTQRHRSYVVEPAIIPEEAKRH